MAVQPTLASKSKAQDVPAMPAPIQATATDNNNNDSSDSDDEYDDLPPLIPVGPIGPIGPIVIVGNSLPEAWDVGGTLTHRGRPAVWSFQF